MPLLELSLNKKPTTVAYVINQLEIAADDLLFDAASAVEDELNKQIRKMRAKTANRGRGRFADEYDDPLKGAKAETKKLDDNTIRVNVDNKVFNILDAGSPGASSSDYMTFPVYDGNLTREDSLTLNSRVRVENKPQWVKTKEVDGFEPRNFYKNAAKRRTLTQARKRRGKSIFRFPLDPDYIGMEVVDGS